MEKPVHLEKQRNLTLNKHYFSAVYEVFSVIRAGWDKVNVVIFYINIALVPAYVCWLHTQHDFVPWNVYIFFPFTFDLLKFVFKYTTKIGFFSLQKQMTNEKLRNLQRRSFCNVSKFFSIVNVSQQFFLYILSFE